RVTGPVVDVEFPRGSVPDLFNALHADITFGDLAKTLTLEVAQHLGDNMVRCISMQPTEDRKSTRLNSSHVKISYAVFCLQKNKQRAAADHERTGAVARLRQVQRGGQSQGRRQPCPRRPPAQQRPPGLAADDLPRLLGRNPVFLADQFRFFFNAAATTEIYTLSLHDALPI